MAVHEVSLVTRAEKAADRRNCEKAGQVTTSRLNPVSVGLPSQIRQRERGPFAVRMKLSSTPE